LGLCGVAYLLSRSQVQVMLFSKDSNNIIVTDLSRRGHPGNLVLCNETGEVFASQNRAAQAMGINASELSKNIRGLVSDAGGFTFTKLGEAS
jgi:hypothetical protein